MNTGPAAWDEVDFLSQWVAGLFGGGPDNQAEGYSDPALHNGPCGDHVLSDQPGDSS